MAGQKLGPDDAGAWIANTFGRFISGRIVKVAILYGYDPSAEYKEIIKDAENRGGDPDSVSVNGNSSTKRRMMPRTGLMRILLRRGTILKATQIIWTGACTPISLDISLKIWPG